MKKRALLCDALTSVGFVVSVPEGAYYVFTRYRGVRALSQMSSIDAAMFMIECIGVAPVPGGGFYDSGNDGEEYLRFTFVRSIPLLEDAATRLSKLNDYDENGKAVVSSSAL